MRYGIIDIGSNTFRLIIAEVGDDFYSITDGFKETVRLSAGLDENNILSEEKLNYGFKTLKMFKKYCELSKTDEIKVVATAALRKAENRDLFLKKARLELNLEVQLLSGDEEANYDFLGAVNSISIKDFLFMDIGGGSTEIGLVKNRQLQEEISIPIGAVDLARKFYLENNISKNNLKDLETYLERECKKIDWVKKNNGLPLIGIGGTIRNIGKIRKREIHYPLNSMHNFEIELKDVKDIYDRVSNKNLEDRKKINGLGSDRADIFVGATCAVKKVMEYSNSSKLVISREGVREGLIYSKLGYNLDNTVKNPLKFSVKNMLKVYDSDIEHPEHVLFLFTKLFTELKDVHNIKEDVSNIIYASAMLHDIGKMLDYKNHYEHSFYIMLNSILRGLSNEEQLKASIVAGLHTGSKLKINKKQYKKIKKLFSKEEVKTLKKLGVLLAIAEGLDRSLSLKVKDLKCRRIKDYVMIKAINYDDISIELTYLKKFKNDFKKRFGLEMMIV